MNARFQNAQASVWMGIVGQEEENFGHKMVSTKFILKFKGAVKR
jgi:hypothetical protein